MSQPEVSRRPVAAGGWRRAVVGLFVGAVAGALAAAALPDEARQRRRGR